MECISSFRGTNLGVRVWNMLKIRSLCEMFLWPISIFLIISDALLISFLSNRCECISTIYPDPLFSKNFDKIGHNFPLARNSHSGFNTLRLRTKFICEISRVNETKWWLKFVKFYKMVAGLWKLQNRSLLPFKKVAAVRLR